MLKREEENQFLDWLQSNYSTQGHVVTPSRFEHDDHSMIPRAVERFAWASRHHVKDPERGTYAEPTASPTENDRLYLVARNYMFTIYYARFDLTSWLRKVGFLGSDALGDYTIDVPAPPKAGYCSSSVEPVTHAVRLRVSVDPVPSETVTLESKVWEHGSAAAKEKSTAMLVFRYSEMPPAGQDAESLERS